MPVKPSSTNTHRAQVARARRYLRANLDEAVTLQQIARAAAASPWHFARLYRAFTGETVFRTLTRLRLEKATRLLRDSRCSISHIALEVGFATPSSFNKAFANALRLSPSAFRAADPRRQGRLGATLRAPTAPRAGEFRLSRLPVIRERPELRVAFVRELGEYGEVAAPLAWQRLDACLTPEWSGHQPVGASHDDTRTVLAESLRYDAGIVLEPGEAPPRGTAVATWSGGPHAMFLFRGPYRLITKGFERLFRTWVSTGRLVLRDAPLLEVYRNSPADTAERNLLTELWFPVAR